MNRQAKLITVVALAALAVPVLPKLSAFVKPWFSDVPPPLSAVPAKSPVELAYAQPFTLGSPATHYWRKEQPSYTSGYVVVLKVDPTLVHPREAAEPVLYVGAQTAERVNHGHESGYVVAIVPSAAKPDGGLALDLSASPIFFGTAELPERIDAARIENEIASARRAGATPPTAAGVSAAMQPSVEFGDDYELRLFCSDLIAQYSPTETDLVNGMRVPRITK